MNRGTGLRVCIGHGRVRAPGFLAMDDAPGADIPHRAGDAFPFEDRAVDAIVAAGIDNATTQAALLGLLLECRRSLRVGGALRVVATRQPAGRSASAVAAGDALDERLEGLATMAGLHRHATPLRLTVPEHRRGQMAPSVHDFTKPDRQVRGDPLVSIVIPAYRARFFRASLRSALAQTFPRIEILVCDDSQDDEIASIVRECDTRRVVRYVRNPARLRSRANYRRGLELAAGEFIKFLNDDDLLAPDCVARLLHGFRDAPDVALATSHRRRIGERGGQLADQPATMQVVAQDTLVGGVSLANAMLMAGLNIVGEPSTVLFRKSDLADQAPEYFRFHGADGRGVIDMTMWSALLLKGDAVYLDDRLSSFRIHGGQQQHDSATVQRSAGGIRGLQAAWLALGLHRRRPPDALDVRPFPFDPLSDWTTQRVLSFSRIEGLGAPLQEAPAITPSAGFRAP